MQCKTIILQIVGVVVILSRNFIKHNIHKYLNTARSRTMLLSSSSVSVKSSLKERKSVTMIKGDTGEERKHPPQLFASKAVGICSFVTYLNKRRIC